MEDLKSELRKAASEAMNIGYSQGMIDAMTYLHKLMECSQKAMKECPTVNNMIRQGGFFDACENAFNKFMELKKTGYQGNKDGNENV